eukprot:m.61013 g.61013  ORF g.61013 m.61013 type:complete len:829 (-) comp22918_c1_seq2:51-2537(-)
MMSESDGPGSPMRKQSGADDPVITMSVMDMPQMQTGGMTMVELPLPGQRSPPPPSVAVVPQQPPQQSVVPVPTVPTPAPLSIPISIPPIATPNPQPTVTPATPTPVPSEQKPTRVPTLPTSWFFKHSSEQWSPFSRLDSSALEMAVKKSGKEENSDIITDGGRYRVDMQSRSRQSIFWTEPACDVRRASWYVGHDSLDPLSEDDAAAIEEQFGKAWMNQTWKVKLNLSNGDVVELRNENFFVLFPCSESIYSLPSPEYNSEGKIPPRMLRRGYPKHVAVGEEIDAKFDHCVLVLPGAMAERPYLSNLGFAHSEAKRGTFIDCVDSMRIKAQTLLSSNFEATDSSRSSGKMEFLPITWADDTANDETMKDAEGLILDTQQNLRRVLSKEIVDSLCYYSEASTAVHLIVQELNQVVQLFKERNPTFGGSFHVVGYGLGACYLHDIMSSQGVDTNASQTPPPTEASAVPEPATVETESDVAIDDSDGEDDTDDVVTEDTVVETTWQEVLTSLGMVDFIAKLEEEEVTMETLKECSDADYKELGFNLGQRKKAIKAILNIGATQEKEQEERKLKKEAAKALRVAQRNERRLERRIAAAKNAEQSLAQAQNKLESSRKEQASRERNISCPQLEFEPKTVFFLGAPIGLFVALQPRNARTINDKTKYLSCPRVFNVFHPYDPIAYRLEPLISPLASNVKPVLVEHHAGSKKLHLEFKDYVKETSKDLKKEASKWAGKAWGAFMTKLGGADDDPNATSPPPPAVDTLPPPTPQQEVEVVPPMGLLNNADRIDHVLQEDLLEKINEAMMSMGPHSTYWTSNDATFFIINKVYMVGR